MPCHSIEEMGFYCLALHTILISWGKLSSLLPIVDLYFKISKLENLQKQIKLVLYIEIVPLLWNILLP